MLPRTREDVAAVEQLDGRTLNGALESDCASAGLLTEDVVEALSRERERRLRAALG